ncbi:unnamed protein product [marine sediment metagenome]|uniref:Uncharacterized protein n=1 Tax=marine sediment metagenome TaxID=412755 RepID=X0VB31_9ZZZZ
MVSKTDVTGIGELITVSPTTAKGKTKHPDRLNLILYRDPTKNRYTEWFGDKISEEDIYCKFLNLKVNDSTNTKRDKLFSLIHMISTGQLVLSRPG